MKKYILTTIILLTLSIQVAFTQCTLNKQGWTMTFNEEFNTNIADIKTRWNILNNIPGGLGNDTQYFRSIDVESNFSLNGGFGYFETKKINTPITYNGIQYYYTTSNMISKFDDIPYCSANSNAGYLYGMFEIRCKFPKKTGQYPAYWLHGNTSWPPEIDVYEFNASNPDNFFSTIYWGANNTPQSCGNTYHYPFDLTNDFHTYTLVWTPTKVTWFFDNKELKTDNVFTHIPGTVSPNMWERCTWMKMIHQIGNGLNFPNKSETFFDPLIVDYIKVYKPTGYTTFTSGNFDNWHDNIIKPLYQNTPYKSTQDWILDKVTSIDNYNSLSDMNVIQNGGKFYYKGDNNLLFTTYWYNYGSGPQFYSAPINWSNTIDGNISVATYNEIPFFRKGNQIQYYQNSVFSKITGASNVQSTILTNPNGLQIVYLGTNNNLWECKRTSLATNTWTITQRTTTNNVTPEIIFDNNNYNILYFRNTSNQLVKLVLNTNTSSSTVISTNNDVFSSLAISTTSNRIYYRTSAKNLIYYELSGNIWTRNIFNAISPYSGINSVPVDNVLKNICISDNPHQIYYIGTDNRIWVVYWDGGWKNTAIDWKIDYAFRDLKIINQTTSSKMLTFVGNDNKIRRLFWNTCEQLNPDCSKHQYFRQIDKNKNTEINLDDIILLPNPANDFIELQLPKEFLDSIYIEIYSINGQCLKKVQCSYQNNSISISELNAGLYFMKISNDNNVTIKKFYKN
jgi:hypothetical protein